MCGQSVVAIHAFSFGFQCRPICCQQYDASCIWGNFLEGEIKWEPHLFKAIQGCIKINIFNINAKEFCIIANGLLLLFWTTWQCALSFMQFSMLFTTHESVILSKITSILSTLDGKTLYNSSLIYWINVQQPWPGNSLWLSAMVFNWITNIN